jgi:hypothetical protein
VTREILEEGLGLRFGFANGALLIEELSVKPIGVQGTGGKNTTNHANVAVQTKAPGKLPEITNPGGTCHFAKSALSGLMSQVGVVQLITCTYPGGGSHAFWGWLESFVPNDFVPNQQPTAAFQIIVGNRHGSTGAETLPVYTPPS